MVDTTTYKASFGEKILLTLAALAVYFFCFVLANSLNGIEFLPQNVQAFLQLLLYSGLVVATWRIMNKYYGIKAFDKSIFYKGLFKCFLAFVASFAILYLYFLALNIFYASKNPDWSFSYFNAKALSNILGIIVAGTMEEYSFRYFLLLVWLKNSKQAHRYVIVFVFSTIFASFHAANYPAPAILYTFLAGLFFSIYFLYSKSIFQVIGIHIGHNLAMQLLDDPSDTTYSTAYSDYIGHYAIFIVLIIFILSRRNVFKSFDGLSFLGIKGHADYTSNLYKLPQSGR